MKKPTTNNEIAQTRYIVPPAGTVLVSTNGIAKALGLPYKNVKALVNQPDFPEPVCDRTLRHGGYATITRWDLAEVTRWYNARKP